MRQGKAESGFASGGPGCFGSGGQTHCTQGAVCFITAVFRSRLHPDMPPWLIPLLWIAFIWSLILLGIYKEKREVRRLSKLTVVEPLRHYVNNHHVLGVGYYHATHQRWHPTPWNEFREGKGYYWDGEWHESPDDRQMASSVPNPAELTRVNEAWRQARPRRTSEFWDEVDRFGFGTAIGRRTGS